MNPPNQLAHPLQPGEATRARAAAPPGLAPPERARTSAGARSTGLTSDEAARRLREVGPNALPEVAPLPMWRRVLRQFASPLIYILLAALAIDLASWLRDGAPGAPIEAIAILAVLALNAGIGAGQEYRSEQSLAQLRHLTAPRAWALRDGRLVQVPSADLVPGDVVRVEAGDRIPADGALVDASGLMIDEALVTGESVPVDKRDGDPALSGTLAVRGRALIAIERTGADSAMGRLATLIGGIDTTPTPLERRLDAFGRRIAVWTIALGAGIVTASVLAMGWGDLDRILLFAAALAVGAVPEGLPAVVTLALALGVQRMARRRAVIRRLGAVEALGSVTVIATDKTGTLTENRMTVAAVDADDLPEALAAMALASDAEPGAAGEDGVGDPLELGLLRHARTHGVDLEEVRRARPRVSSRAFDSDAKFMRVTVADGDASTSYLKGAPEVLLARAALSEDARAHWRQRVEARAAEGYRVLGLARSAGAAEDDLTWLGLVMLWDPPRAEVAAAIRAAQDAGIRVVMITGDHPATASAVADTIGIAAGGALTGADVARMSAAELQAAVATTRVFARTAPEHKLAIVEALQARGEIVAVTGDGVNDAPALKRADVGVAMGVRGSDVAREVADVVLLDDNFASIVAAVEEGRGIYANIEKFIRFLFSTNAAEVLVILIGAIGAVALGLRDPAGGPLLPLTVAQMLWINFITDGPPALAIALDRNPHMLQAPPQRPGRALFDRASLRFVLISGCTKALIAGGLLVGLPHLGMSLTATRTAVFLYLSIGQLVFAYPARRMSGLADRNRALLLTVLLGSALQLVTILVPPLRRALGLDTIGWSTLAIVAAAIGLSWAAAEIIARWLRPPRCADLAPAPGGNTACTIPVT
ncbi:MAG: cation-transporting P-type ATPase [Deltaproteobacteria bacterium]|nr:cation-transporting P-type ATPase [Deltaproteobacteria bacterium]